MSLIITPHSILGIEIYPSRFDSIDELREVLNAIDNQEAALKQFDKGLISVDDLFDVTECTGIDMDDYVDTVLQNIEMVERYGIKT